MMKLMNYNGGFSLWNKLRISYRNKLLAGFLFMTIMPIVIIGVFAYLKSAAILEQQVIDSISESAKQINISLSKRLSQVQEVSDLIVSSKRIQDIVFLGDHQSFYDQILDYQYLSDYIGNLEKNFNLQRIRLFMQPNTVYSNEGYNIFALHDLVNQAPVFFSEDYDGKLNWLSTFDYNYAPYSGDSIPIISAFHTFRNIPEGNELAGIFFIDIPESELAKSFDSAGMPSTNSTLTIIDYKGYVVSASDQTTRWKKYDKPYLDRILSSEQGSFINNDSLVTYNTLSPVEWKIIINVPMKDIRSKINVIGNFTAIIGLVAILLAILLSIYISSSLAKRIKHLRIAMKAQGLENKEQLLSGVKTNNRLIGDEIDDLMFTYNKMAERINTLVSEVYDAKIEESEARLKALQAQINPHFLYNILGAIKLKLEGPGDEEAVGMIASLARFFQLSLSKGVDKITIAEELEMIRHYLELQETIYPGAFEWSLAVDPNIEPFIITKFTLQPIVENAISHGVRKIKSKGRVVVRGCFAGDDIVITVSDTGIGMNAETLMKVQRSMESEDSAGGRGYGLRNVNARLKLQWGSPYGLRIESTENEGTTVTVTIPQEV